MARLEYSERFADDLARVSSPRVEERILGLLDSLDPLPELGSRNLPPSVRERFGEGVRKVAANPFDLVYTYYPEDDLVRVEDLVHQRLAR